MRKREGGRWGQRERGGGGQSEKERGVRERVRKREEEGTG